MLCRGTSAAISHLPTAAFAARPHSLPCSDILFGLLKHLVAARKGDLKLVITSATLDGQKFSKFFSDCPVVEVPGRLHPVQIFYSTERPTSYFQSAVETAMGG